MINELKLTKKELIERLLNGDKLYSHSDCKSYAIYDEKYTYPFRYIQTKYGANRPFRKWELGTWYTKTEWYENISPEGVLCWVWDYGDGTDARHISVITGYDKGLVAPFNSRGLSWCGARPIKPEDCYIDD